MAATHAILSPVLRGTTHVWWHVAMCALWVNEWFVNYFTVQL
jgi:hypothetical protein